MGFFRKRTADKTITEDVVEDAGETKTEGIDIENIPDDAPGFKRIYTVKLGDRGIIKIDMHTFFRRRSKSGELTQTNGRWLLFDPDAVADKILDPVLVPIIQEHVDRIQRIDREFIASEPSEFIDERGVRWRRVDSNSE